MGKMSQNDAIHGLKSWKVYEVYEVNGVYGLSLLRKVLFP